MATPRSTPVDHRGTDDQDVEDAWQLVHAHGPGRFALDTITRFRHGDGTSHSRALALQVSLAVIPFLIALTGLAAQLDQRKVSTVIAETVAKVSPGGGSGDALASAVESGGGSGSGGVLALVIGLLLSFVAMTVAMAQVERGANRVNGNDTDRPSKDKYLHAAKLAALLAPALGAGFLLLVAGGSFAAATDQAYGWTGASRTLYDVARWPVGILLLVVAITVLLDRAPERRQPSRSWLCSDRWWRCR